jgi:hypothetical protein
MLTTLKTNKPKKTKMKIIEINVSGQIIRSFYKPYKTFRNAEKFGYNWAISQGFKLFKVEVFSV